MFADFQARHLCANRFELSPDLRRRVGFEIEHVLVTGPTGQKDHDDGLVRTTNARRGFGLKKLWKRKSAETERADLQEIPTGNPITKTGSTGRPVINSQHGPLQTISNPLAFEVLTGGVAPGCD